MGNNQHNIYKPVSRREMLGICKCGFGSEAFLSLFGSLVSACSSVDSREEELAKKISGNSKFPNFVPKAKNVIFLYMDGGVSQVDSFDPKSRLDQENGQDPRGKFKVDATQFGD